MIATTKDIIYNYGDTIRIVPISDVHSDAADADVNQFKRDIAKQAAIPQTYFLGLGDYVEGIAPSDPRFRLSAKKYRDRDDLIDASVDQFSSYLEPAKGKILGLGRGNHEDKFLAKTGVNLVSRIARNLDTKDLGMSFLYRLLLKEPGTKGRQFQRVRSVTIYGHHGWGGGSRTAGGNLTKFERTRGSFDADIFLFGHVHGSKQVDTFVRMSMGPSNGKLIARRQLLGIAGTYLRTMSDGPDPTYAEAKGYPPAEIGHIVVCLQPTHNGLKMWGEG